MTMLAQYDRARAALAEAATIDEVLSIRDEVEHIKLYAKQIEDRELLADAAALQLRFERRLGVLLVAADKAGHLARRGGQKKPDPIECSEPEHSFSPVTLDEIGVGRKLSALAKKHASISEQAFEAMVNATRERVVSGRARIVDNAPINGSRAIMGSRAEPDDSLDYFPTPPWATRALIEHALRQVGRRADCKRLNAWEPACGEGHISEVLKEYFADVVSSDIHDYGYGDHVVDFLICEQLARKHDADWIITNPPFGDKTEGFVLKALDLARVGVAMFVRLQWLETVGRYETIFRDFPPTMIAFFAERVPICKGRWNPNGDTATAYIWLIWVKGTAPKAPFWIPPGCREALTKPDDAARFTTQPVTKREYLTPATPHDPETGEVIEYPEEASGTAREAPSTGCGTAAEMPRVGTQSAPPHLSDDALEVPAFLRRGPDNAAPFGKAGA